MENTWSFFHSYRRLALDGKVLFLSCPTDNNDLITRLGTDDDVVLWCSECDTLIKPGLDVLDQVRAVVKEHNL